MDRIVQAFATEKAHDQIARLLSSGGLSPYACCFSGADTIRMVRKLGDAVVICGFRLRDMTAEMLAADLQGIAPLLVISSPGNLELCSGENLFKLATPATRADFFASLDLLLQFGTGHGGPPAPQHSRPQRSEAEKQTVAKAKALLMDKFSLTEPEAHHYLQKNAMDRGLKLTDLAAKILQSNA